MTIWKSSLATAAVIGGFSALAAVQPPSPYPRPNYDSNIDAIVTKLLGEGYNVTGRIAVYQCANAAKQMAYVQYWPKQGRTAYGADLQRYPYGQGINPAAQMRVTAITGAQRRKDVLRVSGLIDGRAGYPLYGPDYGHAAGDLSFSCDIDHKGIVSNLRIVRANTHRD